MSDPKSNLPFEYKEYKPEELEAFRKQFIKAPHDDFIRVGPKGYSLFKGFLDYAPKIYNFVVRPDDTWVLSFPKSGTTWVQEMVWLVANDCDYETAENIELSNRYDFLEWRMLFNNKDSEDLVEEYSKSDDKQKQMIAARLTRCEIDVCAAKPSPRFIKSHLPLSLLPPTLLDTCKVVHVARDPRDALISFYHHIKTVFLGYEIELKPYLNLLMKDQVQWAPYFENVKESWAQRHHPNMLFIFYEDLLKDLPAGVRRVAKFLGKTMTEDQVSRLANYLTFDNFKKKKTLNVIPSVTKKHILVRKGKSGEWKECFDDEMKEQAKKWMEDNLRGSDLKYPEQ